MNFEKYQLPIKVLEAGGHIEERAGYPDFRKFEERYVFTKESLERLLSAEREACAQVCLENWRYTADAGEMALYIREMP